MKQPDGATGEMKESTIKFGKSDLQFDDDIPDLMAFGGGGADRCVQSSDEEDESESEDDDEEDV